MKTACYSSKIMMMPERLRPDALTMHTRMKIRAIAAARGIKLSAHSLRYYSMPTLEAALAILEAGGSIKFVFAVPGEKDADSIIIPEDPNANETP